MIPKTDAEINNCQEWNCSSGVERVRTVGMTAYAFLQLPGGGK